MKLTKNCTTSSFSINCLWSCSWVQYFMVINESNQPIEVNYTITPPEKTFAIFENKPDCL
jgi:hypothetical protein